MEISIAAAADCGLRVRQLPRPGGGIGWRRLNEWGACRAPRGKQGCALPGAAELGSGARKDDVCSVFVLKTMERSDGKQHANRMD